MQYREAIEAFQTARAALNAAAWDAAPEAHRLAVAVLMGGAHECAPDADISSSRLELIHSGVVPGLDVRWRVSTDAPITKVSLCGRSATVSVTIAGGNADPRITSCCPSSVPADEWRALEKALLSLSNGLSMRPGLSRVLYLEAADCAGRAVESSLYAKEREERLFAQKCANTAYDTVLSAVRAQFEEAARTAASIVEAAVKGDNKGGER